MADGPPRDPLFALREYRQLAPWNIHDLASLAGAVLDAAGVRPTSGAASVRPNERTVRYYVTRGLVAPPEGRGAAATYSYRHLLQLLAIKLRQMEGTSLANIGRELPEQGGDAIERRVAAALGPDLPSPNMLSLRDPRGARGRAGRAIQTWHALGEDVDSELGETGRRFAITKWHRIPIVRGLELHVHEGHPLAQYVRKNRDIGDHLRRAVNQMLAAWSKPGRKTPDNTHEHPRRH